jgi:hypothetical protein
MSRRKTLNCITFIYSSFFKNKSSIVTSLLNLNDHKSNNECEISLLIIKTDDIYMHTSRIGIRVVNVGGAEKQHYTKKKIAHSTWYECTVGNEGCIVTDQTLNKGKVILCDEIWKTTEAEKGEIFLWSLLMRIKGHINVATKTNYLMWRTKKVKNKEKKKKYLSFLPV